MEKLNYEQAMEKLEGLVARLQDGTLSLEETLKLYDEASRLAVFCGELLQNAKQRLTVMEQAAGENNGL
ncbi:MAG: exodeoxyribonuclease VII small subunit [Clostridium sp.]|jgi:exodeoxyribonuclease VII small subunit|nr:exodeoxyribonuclease VII small subunit [Clostridium sp.]